MINDKNKFEKRHVLYCDILGFSAYSTSLFFDPSRCLKIFHYLDQAIAESTKEIYCPDDRYYVVNPEIIYCSDSIIVSTPATNVDAIWLCAAAAKIQNFIALNGFIMRGAIVSDDIYHSGNTIFGPGITKAAALDKSDEPPAIVVSEETLKIFMASDSDKDEEISRIRKQQLIYQEGNNNYIDPYYQLKFAINGNLDQKTSSIIESWRNLIEIGLRNEKVKISTKYDWLAKHFNQTFCNRKKIIPPIERHS
jgi:hypothetical protein